MTKDLTEFLDVEGGPADADPPEIAAETSEAVTGEIPATKPDAKAAVVEEAAEEIPEDVRGLRGALQAERAKRNDWKGQADRLTGELTATKAQLEAALKPPPAPVVAAAAPVPAAPPAPVTVPNPVEDPAGYHAHTQRLMFNERLNMSEAMLRSQHPDADVDARLAVFKKAADANPALRAELSRQSHPYKWAFEHAGRLMAMEEIGGDPVAYRTRIEAEIRAKIEAEATGAPAPAVGGVVAAVRLPRSLGTVPSAAPRMAVVEEAPSFEDTFRRTKRA